MEAMAELERKPQCAEVAPGRIHSVSRLDSLHEQRPHTVPALGYF